MSKELTLSLEKYLLALYEIIEQNGAARVRDVAENLKIGAASASEAVKNLAKKKYINYKPYGIITLTEKGKITALEKKHRKETISKFLKDILKIDFSNVEKYAADIEFSMPDDVLKRFVEYLDFMSKCSCKEPKWIKSFQYYIANGDFQEKCKRCSKNKELFDNSYCCGCK